MHRIYWRVAGAEVENRPGGPWWCNDFPSREEAFNYWYLIKAYVKEARYCKVHFGTPTGYPWDIYPPEDSVRL